MRPTYIVLLKYFERLFKTILHDGLGNYHSIHRKTNIVFCKSKALSPSLFIYLIPFLSTLQICIWMAESQIYGFFISSRVIYSANAIKHNPYFP